jgi:tetratricopeptide (TPR) repeat protein
MDLLDFDAGPLYFDDPIDPDVVALISDAANLYPEAEAETLLLRAEELAPRHLEVLVALYRFYFYQNRLDDADKVADKALEISGAGIDYPADWRDLTVEQVVSGLADSASMARFWLLSLKAKAVLALRQERIDDALAMLGKIADVDERDRLGARGLIEVARIHASNNVIAVDFAASSL